MEWTNQLAAIGAVLLLAVLFASAIRRRRLAGWLRRGAGPQELEVIRRIAMGPQHVLHQVRWGKTDLLVVVYPTGCSVLQTRDRSSEEFRDSEFRNLDEPQGVHDERATR